MTISPQSHGTGGEKEYRITESELKKLEFVYATDVTDDGTTVHDRIDFTNRIRSRPIAAATPSDCRACIGGIAKPCGNPIVGCPYHTPNPCEVGDEPCTCLESRCNRIKDHDATIRREAYDQGAREERERVLEVISDGKSALYEIKPDGNWDYILQAKMDVLCWIEESLRSSK